MVSNTDIKQVQKLLDNAEREKKMLLKVFKASVSSHPAFQRICGQIDAYLEVLRIFEELNPKCKPTTHY